MAHFKFIQVIDIDGSILNLKVKRIANFAKIVGNSGNVSWYKYVVRYKSTSIFDINITEESYTFLENTLSTKVSTCSNRFSENR